MNNWQQRFWNQFPPWAHPAHTIFRHLQTRLNIVGGRSLREILNLSLLIGALVLTVSLLNIDDRLGLAEPGTWRAYNLLYVPLLAVQSITYALALVTVASSFAEYRQQGSWDTFKITSHGADLVVRARWAAAFFQLRWLLLAICVTRVVFCGLILVDLTGQQGRALDQALVGITPPVSLGLSVPLLATIIAAALVQVLVIFGLNAALGLLIGVIARGRGVVLVTSFVVLALELAIMGFALLAGHTALNAHAAGNTNTLHWLYLLVFGTLGDQGLRFLDMRSALQSWAAVDYGVLIGVAWLGVWLLQVKLIALLLDWASRLASRPTHG